MSVSVTPASISQLNKMPLPGKTQVFAQYLFLLININVCNISFVIFCEVE